MAKRIHSMRLLFRKPHRILLCSFANLLVLLFTVIEGVRMTETRAAVEEAMESRVYSGALVRTAGSESGTGPSDLYREEGPVGRDAYEILKASPHVDSVEFCEPRAARFGGGTRCVEGDAAAYAMIVGRVTGEPYVVGNSVRYPNRVRFRPTYIAAGDPDAVHVTYAEYAVFPTIMLPPMDEPPAYHHGERYFIFAPMYHETRNPADGIYPLSGKSLIAGEEPGDEMLSDADFAEKVMEKHGLFPYAERLADILDMTSVTEIPSVETLLPWRSGLMRIVTGRTITEKDGGKKVCMCPVSMLAAMRKKVGEKILLSLSEENFPAAAGRSSVPTIFEEFDPESFGPAEEYEIVGSYAYDESQRIDAETAYFCIDGIMIPSTEEREYLPVRPYLFSFTVHKDAYESYLFETEPLLREAGYRVVMARPEYADAEAEFEKLQSNTLSSFLTAGLALLTGLLIAAGSLVLFWRDDYFTERRLGAKRREAAGLYLRAFGTMTLFSLCLSALALFLLGKTGAAPFLEPGNLSPAGWGSMALFALAEILLFFASAAVMILAADRRKFGG